MKNSDKIKKAFSEITVSESLERRILNMTVNKEEKAKKRFKPVYICCVVLLVCALSFSAVYAENIKEFIESWSASVDLGNGEKLTISENNSFKVIPDTAIKVGEDENSPVMSFKEIEDMLGFKLLKLRENNTDEIYYRTAQNDDGSIGKIDLWIPCFVKINEDKQVSVSVNMLSQNADEKYVSAFLEGLDASGGKKAEKGYMYAFKSGPGATSEETNIVIYSNDWSSERLTAVFVYDDVLYEFVGKNMSQQEMTALIESLTE